MTNYNERLDEILDGIDKAIETRVLREPLTEDAWVVGMRLMLKKAVTDEAKQAITSLIKELVAEAKPEITFSKPEGMPNTLAVDFAQRHLNQFEQNLLKALEEV